MYDRDQISQFTLKGGVEICAPLDGSQTVAVRQLGKDADITVVFELDAYDWAQKGLMIISTV